MDHITKMRLAVNSEMDRAMKGTGMNEYGGVTNRTVGLQELIASVLPIDTVIEVGSNRGVSTEAFALMCKQVVAVDCWNDKAHDPDGPFLFNAMMLRNPNVSVMKMYSTPASFLIKDKSVDMAYIDASHSYEEVKQDIAMWIGKAKYWLAGHDYCQAEPGVIRAVNETGFKPRVFSDSSWLLSLGK